MTDRKQIINLIEELMDDIEKLDVSCNSDGWGALNQAKILNMLRKLRKTALNNEKLPPINIPRGMDSFGIVSGDLVQKGAVISCLIKDYNDEVD